MIDKTNEERIASLEKTVEEQQNIIERMISIIPFSKEVRVFIYNTNSLDSAERYRPPSGGKVYNRAAKERTRPWSSGNT